MSVSAVNGLQNAQVMFDMAANRATQASAAIASTEPLPPDAPDLTESMVGMMTAQLAYTASAKVLEMSMEQQRTVLDLLA